VQLTLGQTPITKDFVPVWCLGKASNIPICSGNFQSTVNGQLLMQTFATNGSYQTGEGDYLWEFSSPMYVPAGMVLVPVFQHKGQISDAIRVNVVYYCRAIDPSAPAPSKLVLPYAATWESPSTTVSPVTAASYMSTEADLANTSAQPIKLKRLTGRIASFITSITSGGSASIATAPDTLLEVIAYETCTLQLYDQTGFPIINNPTKWRSVFSGATRSWEMDSSLESGAYLIATVGIKASQNQLQEQFTGNFSVQMGMIGERTIDKVVAL